jgi:hypothetical protein
MDQDRYESLDRCIDELRGGLLTPPCDLGGALSVAAPLGTGQLGCHLGHRPGGGLLGPVVRRAAVADVF